MSYPYSARETFADGTVHVAGISFAITGAVVLILYAAESLSAGQITALSIYGGVVIFSFVVSALYHLSPFEGARRVLRRLDHAAIYLKIAGTYTPLVVLIGGFFSYTVLGFVWTLAALGAIARLSGVQIPHPVGTGLYLALGWASVVLIWPMAQTLPWASTALIVAGGCLYTAGALFYLREDAAYLNATWHSFVLAASSCFFAAISVASFA